jgi:hypothetical protein
VKSPKPLTHVGYGSRMAKAKAARVRREQDERKEEGPRAELTHRLSSSYSSFHFPPMLQIPRGISLQILKIK